MQVQRTVMIPLEYVMVTAEHAYASALMMVLMS